MRPPHGPPIGLILSRTAKSVSRAFDDALTAAGGSRSTWLILLSLKTRPTANQRQIADAVGIRGATLTHHLNGLERDGLLLRRRDPENRRTHLVELSATGEEMFLQLRTAAMAFDSRLRSGLSGEDVAVLARLLLKLDENAGETSAGTRQREPGT